MSGIEWFYVEGDQRVGPVSADKMSARLAAGKMTLETLVWCEGMEAPQAVSGLVPDHLKLSLTALDRAGLIAPWSRGYARFIDLCLFQIPILPVMNPLPKLWEGGLHAFADGVDQSVLIIVYLLGMIGLVCLALLIGLVLEALVMVRFGTTPGKWLFRLTVRQSDGARVPIAGLVRRQIGILIYGYGLCIPLINFWRLWASWGRAAHGRRCGWDEAQRLTVRQLPISPLRRCLGFAVFVLALWLASEA